jgi:hypothetical protein
MKLFRPRIPITVKVLVARRQLREMRVPVPGRGQRSLSAYHEELMSLLTECMGGGQMQLDHDPALGLRERRGTGRYAVYSPRANDPRYLVYRPKAQHLEKTTGRKADAERTVTTKGSDIWAMKKFRKLEGPKKRKMRIPSRPFPTIKRRFGG